MRAARRPRVLVALLALVALVVLAGCAAQPGPLDAAMDELKASTVSGGAARIDGTATAGAVDVPALYFGETPATGDTSVVDGVQANHGADATLFVRSGDAFIRVATTIVGADGARILGSALDPAGPVVGPLTDGQAFRGKAAIGGVEYDTLYVPITDATGAVIGAWFVGTPAG